MQERGHVHSAQHVSVCERVVWLVVLDCRMLASLQQRWCMCGAQYMLLPQHLHGGDVHCSSLQQWLCPRNVCWSECVQLHEWVDGTDLQRGGMQQRLWSRDMHVTWCVHV